MAIRQVNVTTDNPKFNLKLVQRLIWTHPMASSTASAFWASFNQEIMTFTSMAIKADCLDNGCNGLLLTLPWVSNLLQQGQSYKGKCPIINSIIHILGAIFCQINLVMGEQNNIIVIILALCHLCGINLNISTISKVYWRDSLSLRSCVQLIQLPVVRGGMQVL